MSGRAKKVSAPKKKANGYKMPAPIPMGELINDSISKKKWRVGPSIGSGGFGEIYSACEHTSSPKKAASYPFVIKIEPHENGPLFVEMHFYIKNANKDDIAKFMKDKKLSTFGMPSFYGNGSHEFKGERYRYLVLERYGQNIWNLFLEAGRSFPSTTVFLLGLQMLDVLEYIHNKGYVHADIKGANILMGLKKGTQNQAYLVDFGLASRVNDKEFKPDPKCAHNGTIEYTSRDAHLGVPTMRGDLEILGYNMLQWIVGELPWEKNLKQPKTVQAMKETFMKNVRSEVNKLSNNVPDALIKFFEYINSLKPKDNIDYIKCRQLFETYLKSEGVSKLGKLEFTPTKKRKTNKALDVDEENDTSEEKSPTKKAIKVNGDLKVTKRGRKPKGAVIEESESEEEQRNIDSRPAKKTKIAKPIPNENNKAQNGKDVKKRGRKPKQLITSEASEDEQQNVNGDSVTSEIIESDNNSENKEPNRKRIAPRSKKRKSSEPSLLVKVKKTKLAPKATPPAKKNHTNIATQTSIDKTKRYPRQVSFDSPISAIIGERPSGAADSSADIFDDSFVIEDKIVKPKPKRKLLAKEEVTVKRVTTKKLTSTKTKGRSWKDSPTVVNGFPPKQ